MTLPATKNHMVFRINQSLSTNRSGTGLLKTEDGESNLLAISKQKFPGKSPTQFPMPRFLSGNSWQTLLQGIMKCLPSRELTYPIKNHVWSDFPFPKVGYVNSLKGKSISALSSRGWKIPMMFGDSLVKPIEFPTLKPLMKRGDRKTLVTSMAGSGIFGGKIALPASQKKTGFVSWCFMKDFCWGCRRPN